MTEIAVAIAALTAAAYLFARGLLGEGGKDAYQALKKYLSKHVSPADLEGLEKNPESQNRQAVLAEDLAKSLPEADPELARLAAALRAEIARAETADPSGAAAALFERVKAQGAIVVEGVSARGAGSQAAVLRDVEAGGEIRLKDIAAGPDSAGNP